MKIPSMAKFKEENQRINRLDNDIRGSLRATNEFEHDREKESYPYIPMDDYERLYGLFCRIHPLNTHGRVSLLDVGAGTGRIVELAKFMGINASGIEYHEPYVTLGREIFGLSEKELVVGDAFKMTKDFLKNFTVIYTYMPLHNHIRMSELHFHIYSHAKPGTLIVEMLPSYYPMNELGVNKVVEFYNSHITAIRKSPYPSW